MTGRFGTVITMRLLITLSTTACHYLWSSLACIFMNLVLEYCVAEMKYLSCVDAAFWSWDKGYLIILFLHVFFSLLKRRCSRPSQVLKP